MLAFLDQWGRGPIARRDPSAPASQFWAALGGQSKGFTSVAYRPRWGPSMDLQVGHLRGHLVHASARSSPIPRRHSTGAVVSPVVYEALLANQPDASGESPGRCANIGDQTTSLHAEEKFQRPTPSGPSLAAPVRPAKCFRDTRTHRR